MNKKTDKTAAILLRFGTLTLLAPAWPAHAAWETIPELALSAITVDNARLRPDSEDAEQSTATELDARVTLRAFGERGSALLEPRIRVDTYADERDKELESEDVFFRASADYDWTNVGIGFRSNFSEESVKRSELLDAEPIDPDLEDPVPVDSGVLTFLDDERRRFQVNPYIDFRISERNRFLLELNSLDVAYSEQRDNRSDFTNKTLEAGIVRRVDERNQVSALLEVSRYEAPRTNNTTDRVGVLGTFTRPISEAWTVSLTAGVRRSDFSFVANGEVVDNADTNFEFGLRLRGRTQLTTLNIDLGRTDTPSSTGFVVVRDQLRFFLSRRFSPRITAQLSFLFFNAETLDNRADTNDRDYARIEFQIDWNLTERWFVSAGYDYTSQEFINSGVADATSSLFHIGMIYRGRSR